MKQTEHDNIVSDLKKNYENQAQKLMVENAEVLEKMITAASRKGFNDGANQATKHTQIAICKGFVDLIQELYVRGVKQIENEREEAQGATEATEETEETCESKGD